MEANNPRADAGWHVVNRTKSKANTNRNRQSSTTFTKPKPVEKNTTPAKGF
jgi:hypothetical protein